MLRNKSKSGRVLLSNVQPAGSYKSRVGQLGLTKQDTVCQVLLNKITVGQTIINKSQ